MPYIQEPGKVGVSWVDAIPAGYEVRGGVGYAVEQTAAPVVDILTITDLINQSVSSGFSDLAEQFQATQQPTRSAEDMRAEIEALYSYWPPELLDVVIDGYVDHGDPNRALAEARNDPVYEEFFPGNKREDGSLRYTEQGYASYIERAQIALASVNVNPDLFGQTIVDAISSGVQVNELEQRIDAVYERVIDRAPEMREQYATFYGIENLTDSALIAGVLNPDIGQQILEGQITNAEIGGEAALRGFGIELDLADRLRQRGVTGSSAADLFGQAAEQLPVLDVLARRHDDPDDEFDLNDFLTALIFDDPAERRRIRRLVAQERSSFSQAGTFATNRLGLTGLTSR